MVYKTAKPTRCRPVYRTDEKVETAAMEPRPLIADLCGQYEAPATISFHDLELATQGPSPAIVGYHHLFAETGIRGVDSRHTKAFIKGHKAAVQVADLFNNNKNNEGVKDPASMPMRVTSSGLVKGPSADEEQGQNIHEAILWFEKTQFQFQALTTTAGNWTSAHYLHFSNPLPPQTGSGIHDITLISGVCLFSEKIVSASIPKGHGVHVQALELPKPTLYEVETIARTSPVIADLISMLDNDGTDHSNGDSILCRDSDDDGPNRRINLNLDVPSFHYYQTLDTRLRDALCTFREAIQWMDAIDKRHHQIIRVFHRYILHELSRRPRRQLRQQRQKANNIQQITPLPAVSVVCEIIRNSLQNERLPSLDHVLQMLTIHDPTWTGFYALIPEKERPRDFRDLGYLFYVYQVARPALIEQHNLNPNPKSPSQSNPLIIGVDDIHERRIYARAQKLLKRVRTKPEYPTMPHLLETYTCNRIFIDQNWNREQGKANLYCRDPSPGGMILKDKEVVTVKEKSMCRSKFANGHGYCENGHVHGDGTILDTFDVISALFGSHAAIVLKGLFADEGLGG